MFLNQIWKTCHLNINLCVANKGRLCTVPSWQIRIALQTDCFFVTCKWGGSCSIYVRWGRSVSAAHWFWSGLRTCQVHRSGVSSLHYRSWKKSEAGKRYVCWKEEAPKREDEEENDVKAPTFSSWCLCTFLLFNLKCTCKLSRAARLLSSSSLKREEKLKRRCLTEVTHWLKVHMFKL